MFRNVVSTSHVKQNHTDSSLAVESFVNQHALAVPKLQVLCPVALHTFIGTLSALDLPEKIAGSELNLIVDSYTNDCSSACIPRSVPLSRLKQTATKLALLRVDESGSLVLHIVIALLYLHSSMSSKHPASLPAAVMLSEKISYDTHPNLHRR